MKRLLQPLWFGFIALFHSAFLHAAAGEYDLIIRNGKIVDGSGNPWFHGDVAIKRDRIAGVGRIAGEATRVIDAAGLVVAPGFIDMHSHSDWVLLEDGNAQSKIREGVTTEVIGESTSAGPFKGKLSPRNASVKGERIEIRRLSDYFAAVERAGISVNVASYVGEGQVWECVMGTSFDRPGPGEMQEMKHLVAEAMRDGAFGLSTALMMPPSSLATTEDLVELCQVVREHGGIYSTHMRDEGLGVFDSVREAIQIGERAGVPVDILHLKIADEKFWGRMKEVVALIEDARRRGVNVQANVYPYTRGNNDLVSIIPPWAHEGGRSSLLARLGDSRQRERLKHDIRNGVAGWYNHYTAVGGDWRRMLISANNPYKGLTMDRVIAMKSEGKTPPPDPLDILLDLLIEQNGSVSTVYAHHTEEDMNVALSQPWCSIGSDGSALATEGVLRRGNPHPRSFGTFARVLGVYARDRGLLRLEDAVRKMTSLNAAKIGLRDRGLLRTEWFADIAIFDEQRVIDHATYDEPFHYSEGIEYVIVNGQIVIDKRRHTGARPGRALRHESVAAARPGAAASEESPVSRGEKPDGWPLPRRHRARRRPTVGGCCTPAFSGRGLDATRQGRTFSGMDHGKKKFSGSREAPKKGRPLGMVIALAAAGGVVIGSAGTYYFSKPLAAPKPSASPAAGGTPPAQTLTMPPQQRFTPAPQPPGEAPPGKVWSVEHGHWHDAPGALTLPATATVTPAPATVTPAPATVTPAPETTPAPAPEKVTPATPPPAPGAAPAEKQE